MTRNILPKSEEMQIPFKKYSAQSFTTLPATTTTMTSPASSNLMFVSNLAKTTAMSSRAAMLYSDEDTASSFTSTTSTSAFGSSAGFQENVKKANESAGGGKAAAAAAAAAKSVQQTVHLDLNKRPFTRLRLNQWHTNEEIYNILVQCNQLVELVATPMMADESSGKDDVAAASKAQLVSIMSEWLTDDVAQYPVNGAVFIFDRRKVKNFKKDSFTWKRRKTGGANSVREDRMCLKVNGVDCIYGCYSHSSLMPTFHRRCYWLLEKPDIVLVHYLQTPNSETGECLVIASNIISSVSVSSTPAVANTNQAANQEWQLGREELKAELKAMLWPYYLSQSFITENLKSNSLLTTNTAPVTSQTSQITNASTSSQCDFIDKLTTHLVHLSSTNKAAIGTVQPSLRIYLSGYLNQFTPDCQRLLTPSLTYNLSSSDDLAAGQSSNNDQQNEQLNQIAKTTQMTGGQSGFYLMLSSPFVLAPASVSVPTNATNSSSDLVKQETLVQQQQHQQQQQQLPVHHHSQQQQQQSTEAFSSLVPGPSGQLVQMTNSMNTDQSQLNESTEKSRAHEQVQLSINSCNSNVS